MTMTEREMVGWEGEGSPRRLTPLDLHRGKNVRRCLRTIRYDMKRCVLLGNDGVRWHGMESDEITRWDRMYVPLGLEAMGGT